MPNKKALKMNTGHLQAERAEKAQQESKHTPGPWEVGNACRVEVWQPNPLGGNRAGRLLLRVQEGGHGPDEANANARLIAAAPDMLKALEGLLKATRKAYDTACNSNDDFADDDAHFVGEWMDEAKAVIAKAKGKAK